MAFLGTVGIPRFSQPLRIPLLCQHPLGEVHPLCEFRHLMVQRLELVPARAVATTLLAMSARSFDRWLRYARYMAIDTVAPMMKTTNAPFIRDASTNYQLPRGCGSSPAGKYSPHLRSTSFTTSSGIVTGGG